jgi:hypothetical protein
VVPNDRRLILVAGTRCSANCSYCYYSGRVQPEEHSGIGLLMDIVDSGLVSKVAIGLNPGFYKDDLKVLKRAARRGLDIVVTTRPDPDILYALPKKGIGILSITYTPQEIDRSTIKFLLGKVGGTRLVLSIMDTTLDMTRGMHESWAALLNGFDAIYYLMEKGHPDRGWRMTTDRKREYYRNAALLAKSSSIPVQVDICVRGAENCLNVGVTGGWLEVDSSGRLRTCPYNVDHMPDHSIERPHDLVKERFPGTTFLNARSIYSMAACDPGLEEVGGEVE